MQIISVDIAVDHLTEGERRKCLEMEVIVTAEGDDELAETRKTVAQRRLTDIEHRTRLEPIMA